LGNHAVAQKGQGSENRFLRYFVHGIPILAQKDILAKAKTRTSTVCLLRLICARV